MSKIDGTSFWDGLSYFDRSEWRKDPNKASKSLVLLLDAIRGATSRIVKGGIPIIIHVCWDDSGHAEKSYHYSGQAVDFHFVDDGQTVLQEAMLLLSFQEIGGLGIYPDWHPHHGWHVDNRNASQAVLWTYMDGRYITSVDGFTSAIQRIQRR